VKSRVINWKMLTLLIWVQASSVTIDKDNTTVVGGKGKKEDITARVIRSKLR
jgi:hypothetical protein